MPLALSVIIATIDRPESLYCALTTYARWPRGDFDVWVMDDSGSGVNNVAGICDAFRTLLDVHLINFVKPPNLWRGPEMAYSVGLASSHGAAKAITQEGVAVPCDMLPRLERALSKHPVVNVSAFRMGDYGLEDEAFLSRPVATDELLDAYDPIFPNDATPMWWCETSTAWQKMKIFSPFPRKNCQYGATDGTLRVAREKAGLPLHVPDDMTVVHMGVMEFHRWNFYEDDSKLANFPRYQVVY